MFEITKRIIKKSTWMYTIISFFYFYLLPNFIYSKNRFFRKYIAANNKYKTLEKYKGIHKGKRCFIVATGPSLTIADLEKLEGETTFSMNSIVLAFPKTKWRPTYYGIQDPYVYEKIREEIESTNMEHRFYGDRLKKMFDIPSDSIIFPHNLLNHKIKHKVLTSKFSSDIYLDIFDGYTITYSLLQVAVYMGFKEIYLLGADTNYTPNNQHFVEYDHVDSSFAQAGEKMIAAYKVAKDYADKNDIKIFNATRGGMLEVFPRVNLDEVLE